jgi:hypothetical protein
MDNGGVYMYDSREDTKQHIQQVRVFIEKIAEAIIDRGHYHDQSKLQSPEKEIFDEYTPKLAGTTYGSEEYKTYLEEMKVALSHHYSKNRHHPEYHPNGIHDMNLVDLIEMLCDWKAATMRHNDGDIMKSIEINQERFGYGDEIKQIMINTVKYYFE